MRTIWLSMWCWSAAFLCHGPIQAEQLLGDCNEISLRSAIGKGGLIRFSCSNTIVLSAPLVIEKDTILDGGKHGSIGISGNDVVRVLHVKPGVSLTMTNLTVLRGRGEFAGGLWNEGGHVRLVGCSFEKNMAIGRAGKAGDVVTVTNLFLGWSACDMGLPGGSGGDGFGGAIVTSGTLVATHTRFLDNLAAGGSGGLAGATSSKGGGATLVDRGGAGGTGFGGAIQQQGG